ncbi:MAG TPA: hypothetical protein VMV92_24795 [Streptosporangiaceae bacterium]|nr:hypothetical protein [Streptosporangiaceae bacterium]
MQPADGLDITYVTLPFSDDPVTVPVISLPASAFTDLHDGVDVQAGNDDHRPGMVTRWQPWDTGKSEERVRLTIGEEASTDDPVRFLAMLEEVSPAALHAIRLELATWGSAS